MVHARREPPGEATIERAGRVDRRTVVRAGAAIPPSPQPRIVLVTCWPSHALFFTPERLLVTAHLVAAGTLAGRPPSPRSTPEPTLAAALPAALTRRDLTLRSNFVPMGTLRTVGRFGTGWLESAGPLGDEEQSLRLLNAATETLRLRRVDWWRTLAPGLPFATGRPLAGCRVDYLRPLQVTLVGARGRLVAIRLATVVRAATGPVDLRITMTPEHGLLVIAGWRSMPD